MAPASPPSAWTPIYDAPSLVAQPPVRERAPRAPGKGLPSVESDCAPFATKQRAGFEALNAVWLDDVRPEAFEQCVLVRQMDGTRELGWTWSWPGSGRAALGYPAMVFGWSPWSDRTTDARLPMRVAQVRLLGVRYRVSMEMAGTAPLALSLWLTQGDEVTATGPRAIAARLTLWLDYPRGATPPGERSGLVEVAGARYELWRASERVAKRRPSGEQGGEDTTDFDVYTFRGPNGHRDGTIPFAAFLEHLVSDGRVGGDAFVASVELGNEIFGGSGTTWVEDYDVQVGGGGHAR